MLLISWLFGRNPVRAESPAPCPDGARCAIYLPMLVKAAGGDLAITGIEITQSVQDARNSVPLVAGRAAMLRIFTQTSGDLPALDGIEVRISANASTFSFNAAPREFSAPLSASSSRADYQSTINYPLPAEWLAGEMDLTVQLDPQNRLNETDEANNTLTRHLVFHSVPPLEIVVVPIQYRNPVDGHTYPAPRADTLSDWIRRTYPVSAIQLTWHAPVPFEKDLSQQENFHELLDRVTGIKNLEHGPAATVYYGLVPTQDGAYSWFHGGIAGIGWIGARTAIGLDYAGQTSKIAAHEIGHNLGMGHTPCNVSGTETNYPYPNGSIGQYGLDLFDGRLYPPTTADVMSYCDPKWISDYTYGKLFAAQVRAGQAQALAAPAGAGAPARRKLLLRAMLRPEGVQFLPAYVLSGPAAPPPAAGEYQVQLIGPQGEVLLRSPLPALRAEEETLQLASINAWIPLPDEPIEKIRLLKDGRLLGEQPFPARAGEGIPPAVSATQDGYRLRWSPADRPALVRYSADAGQSWTTLGMDVIGGEWQVNRADLPRPGGQFEVLPADLWP